MRSEAPIGIFSRMDHPSVQEGKLRHWHYAQRGAGVALVEELHGNVVSGVR